MQRDIYLYIHQRFYNVKTKEKECPSSPVVTNLPASSGDTGSIPGLRRPPMPWAAKFVFCNKRSHRNEKFMQLEKSLCSNEDPAQPKIKED